MRTPVIAGNWKMMMTPEQGVELAKALLPLVADTKGVEIIVCPAAISMPDVGRALQGSNIMLGGQNMYPMDKGAFTGETSPTMLKAIGATHCIIGHSERRQYFGESNAFINQKLKAAFEFDLTPILCVGESLEERQSKRTFDVIGSQVEIGFEGVASELASKVIVAYEPIWAIGTGQTASPEQAQEVHQFIRHKLSLKYDKDTAEEIRIQYGGSVKPDNVDELMSKEDIDGALVGGASLTADSFARLVNFKK